MWHSRGRLLLRGRPETKTQAEEPSAAKAGASRESEIGELIVQLKDRQEGPRSVRAAKELGKLGAKAQARRSKPWSRHSRMSEWWKVCRWLPRFPRRCGRHRWPGPRWRSAAHDPRVGQGDAKRGPRRRSPAPPSPRQDRAVGRRHGQSQSVLVHDKAEWVRYHAADAYAAVKSDGKQDRGRHAAVVARSVPARTRSCCDIVGRTRPQGRIGRPGKSWPAWPIGVSGGSGWGPPT